MNSFDRLTALLSRLPGIGPKSAARLSSFLLRADKVYCADLGRAIASLQDKIHPCSVCGSWTEEDPCPVCQDASRDRSVICVVENAQDVRTIEEGASYKGLYHVLGGSISPIDGVGPSDLACASLVQRVKTDGIKEVIIATNPTVEGDTTALYIQKILEEACIGGDASACEGGTNGAEGGECRPGGVAALPIKITRLATGIPVGGDLEYADKLTLMRSFRARTIV